MVKRLLSGIQSTGNMHLGNYFGAVKNWVAMQEEYDAYYMIADLHALTTSYEETSNIARNTIEVVAELIASGIDVDKSTLFVQSKVHEHAELHLILSMITPLPWLERVPTYKSKKEEMKGKDLNTYGFLGYPVLQAADILLYEADVVPVGKDQAPHLELTREIARRFNFLYGTDLLKDPKEKFTEFPVLPGLDGQKMSKSYGNAIYLADEDDVIQSKLKTMFTDPQRLRRNDPGRPEICPVFAFQKIFNDGLTDQISMDCQSAAIGCVDCKKQLAEKMIEFIKPIRQRRAELLADRAELDRLIIKGTNKARVTAANTLDQVTKAIRLVG